MKKDMYAMVINGVIYKKSQKTFQNPLTNSKICGKITTEIKKGRKQMNEAKIKALENEMFKLLKNKPYNVVRSQCDRIGRQICELSSKVKGSREE